MSVQPVGAPGLEPVATATRRAASAEPPGSAESRRAARGPVPQDQVVVSEQARQLSQAAASGKSGTGLQLDPKKLRELAFPAASAPGIEPQDQQ